MIYLEVNDFLERGFKVSSRKTLPVRERDPDRFAQLQQP